MRMGTMTRLISIVAIIGITLTCVLAKEQYSDQYDYLDIPPILENNRLRNQYYHCFMDIEPCKTAHAKFFKEIVPEAMVTKCKKCTERQKEMLETIIDWYTKNSPGEWEAFVMKILKDLKKMHSAQ